MGKNVFFENLKRLIDQKIFVSIFTDIYRESFIGYIIRISEDLLLLYSYEIGKPNGIKIFRLDDITRIRWGTKELDEIESLISLPPNLEAINKITMDNKAVAIKQVQNIFGYVTIHIQSIDKSICFIGEIVEMDDETIIINEFGTIDSQGRAFLLIALQDITRIDSGGIYEEQLLQLYQRRRKSD